MTFMELTDKGDVILLKTTNENIRTSFRVLDVLIL